MAEPSTHPEVDDLLSRIDSLPANQQLPWSLVVDGNGYRVLSASKHVLLHSDGFTADLNGVRLIVDAVNCIPYFSAQLDFDHD